MNSFLVGTLFILFGCGVFTTEDCFDMDLSHKKQASDYPGCSASQRCSKSFTGEGFKHKAMAWLTTQLVEQLARCRTAEAKKQGLDIERISQNYGLWWIRSLSSSWQAFVSLLRVTAWRALPAWSLLQFLSQWTFLPIILFCLCTLCVCCVLNT
ncbi:hypothetical protein LEMLEM_LOCUS7135, partial [Lemmus lemmus]